jgi:hypothetical protein
MSSLPLTKSEFLDRFLADDRGIIVACNILDGLNGGMYNADFIRLIFDWWIGLCNHQNIASSHMIIAALNSLVYEKSPRGFRHADPKPEFKFSCRRKTRLVNDDNEFTTVVSSYIFSLIISNADSRRFYSKGVEFPSTNNQPMKDDALRALMDLHEVDCVFRLKVDSAIGGEKMVWFSIKELVESAVSSAANTANEARDVLGLANRKPDDVIIALHLPAMVLRHVDCARPTFADATTNERFKTMADTASNKKRSSWGHTANLGHLASNRSSLDGFPERIAAPIAQASTTGAPVFTFTPLGKITTLRGHTAYDSDMGYARRLASGRNMHQIKTALLGII